MDKILFVDYADLADYMIDHAKEGKMVYAVLFYDEAKELTKQLLTHPETKIRNLTLHEADYDNYDKEYYVVLDSDMEVDVSEAHHGDLQYHKEGYYFFGDESCIALLSEDADYRVIKAGDGCSYMAEITIGDLEDFDFNEDEFALLAVNKNGDMEPIDKLIYKELKNMEVFDLKSLFNTLKN